MNRLMLGVVLAWLLVGVGADALGRGSISVGPKIWFADPKNVQFLTLEEQISESELTGVQVTYELTEDWWISAMWMEGEFEDSFQDHGDNIGDLGTFLIATVSMEETDAELLLARTFRYADIGIGLRYSKFLRRFSAEGRYLQGLYGVSSVFGTQEEDVLGPMLYLGLGSNFGSWPVGWYASTSVMVADLNGAGAEHFAGEAGFSWQIRNLVLTVGARHKEYFERLEVPVELISAGGGVDETSEWDMAFTGIALGAILVF